MTGVLAGVALTAAVTASAVAAPQYNIVPFGPIGAGTTSSGNGISPNGQFAVGFSSRTGANDAIIWQNGSGTSALPNLITSAPTRPFNSPNSVNNNGVSAGTSGSTFFGSSPLAVLWKNNTATAFPLPAGETLSRANSININETAVGSVDGGSLEQAAIFTAGGSTVMTQTMPNGGVLKTAFGINDAGRIVGQALDPTNAAVTKGFYIDPGEGTAHDIGALAGQGHNSAIPFGVSSNGFITGSSSLNGGSGSLPFFYSTSGGMVEVPLPAGTSQGQGRAVNANGWIVGNSSSATSIPFLYDGTTSVSLQSLLVNAPGWDLTSGTSNAAFGISDNGMITGRGLLNGVVTGFVLVPVPEPTSVGVAAVSVGAMAMRRRRTRA